MVKYLGFLINNQNLVLVFEENGEKNYEISVYITGPMSEKFLLQG